MCFSLLLAVHELESTQSINQSVCMASYSEVFLRPSNDNCPKSSFPQIANESQTPEAMAPYQIDTFYRL